MCRRSFTLMDRRLPVYTDALIPRGLVGRLSTILGSRTLVLLHDASGHPLLITTHRGDQHCQEQRQLLCALEDLKAQERGARGVLATDFQVPDWFGAAFSEVLYQHLLSGMPIGETLLTTRRQFWTQQRNPLGLAYALYSPPSIKFVR